MLIAELPTEDRPRERLAARGGGALADRELLALLLGTGGIRGGGAHELAARLLARWGSVAGLSAAHPADLTEVPGMGPAKAAAVVAAFELSRRADRPVERLLVASPADLAAVCAPLLRGRARERLVAVVCDGANRLLGCEVVSEGAADRALVPVREIVVAVLRRDGKAFGLAHNHPSGNAVPSRADVDATRRVAGAAAAVGLRFLDHVVVTDGTWTRVPVPP